MDLRPELLPPPVTERRRRELGDEIERIGDLLLSGDAVAADAAIVVFNELTGHGFERYHFTGYAGSRSREDFALRAARPTYPRLPDVTREELVEIVRRILDGGPDVPYYLLLLDTNATRRRRPT